MELSRECKERIQRDAVARAKADVDDTALPDIIAMAVIEELTNLPDLSDVNAERTALRGQISVVNAERVALRGQIDEIASHTEEAKRQSLRIRAVLEGREAAKLYIVVDQAVRNAEKAARLVAELHEHLLVPIEYEVED